MVFITAFVVASLEKNGDGCLGSIDITGDWIGTMRSKLSFAYLHQICKDLSSVATGKWRIELADNRRVGPPKKIPILQSFNAKNFQIFRLI